MDLRIADTFTSSLTRLTNEEQKQVKLTVFDLQMNPSGDGNNLHKLDQSNFWAARVSRDIRIIIHRDAGNLVLCHVAHHDDAYVWASRRKYEVHPVTGAAQLVEVRETVREVAVEQPAARPLFAKVKDETLLQHGIPEEWLDEVRKIHTEDDIFKVADHLPQEAAEALLVMATGGTPKLQESTPAANPFDHPDAMRRFRKISNKEELELAFEAPWEKWIVFLHPEQRELVERDYSGPAKVSGSAGTGKTVVALHRAVWLAKKNPESRVLLTTFSKPLANALTVRLNWLLHGTPSIAEQIDVCPVEEIGLRLYRRRFNKKPELVADQELAGMLAEAGRQCGGHAFSDKFIMEEWKEIVDAWQLKTWEEYEDVPRLGRKTRLAESKRRALWDIFEKVIAGLKEKQLMTMPEVLTTLAAYFAATENKPFDFIVVDEAQDMSVSALKFLSALSSGTPNSLFFAGDIAQRIFQPPFPWKSLGINIKGRTTLLKVNYRTSHQIRSWTDTLLPDEIHDGDSNGESRRNTISIFDGAVPCIKALESQRDETKFVADTLSSFISQGMKPGEIGIFVRSRLEIQRAQKAAAQAGLQSDVLDEYMQPDEGRIAVGTMHQAKGLEYRAVIVMACDENVIPSAERIDTMAELSDFEEILTTERYLLYVACTRAREYLLVTGVKPVSEFLTTS